MHLSEFLFDRRNILAYFPVYFGPELPGCSLLFSSAGWMTLFEPLRSEVSFPKKARGDLGFRVFTQPSGHCDLSSPDYLCYMAGSQASACLGAVFHFRVHPRMQRK